MSEHGKIFDDAQRSHDAQEPPEYWEDDKAQAEIFDYIQSVYAKSDLVETWTITVNMTKLVKTGVYHIDLGEFSGSGQSKDEALKDLCEEIVGGAWER